MTRRPYYLFHFWPFTTDKIGPMVKVSSKFCQILNKPGKIGLKMLNRPKCAKLSQSGNSGHTAEHKRTFDDVCKTLRESHTLTPHDTQHAFHTPPSLSLSLSLFLTLPYTQDSHSLYAYTSVFSNPQVSLLHPPPPVLLLHTYVLTYVIIIFPFTFPS